MEHSILNGKICIGGLIIEVVDGRCKECLTEIMGEFGAPGILRCEHKTGCKYREEELKEVIPLSCEGNCSEKMEIRTIDWGDDIDVCISFSADLPTRSTNE